MLESYLEKNLIEHDSDFQQLIAELDRLESSQLGSNSAGDIQLKISNIKKKLYQKLKSGIENNNVKDTDLFNDPDYLNKLTDFYVIADIAALNERRKLIKRFRTFLIKRRNKETGFFVGAGSIKDLFTMEKTDLDKLLIKNMSQFAISFIIALIISFTDISLIFTLSGILLFGGSVGFLILPIVLCTIASIASIFIFMHCYNSYATKALKNHRTETSQQKFLSLNQFDEEFEKEMSEKNLDQAVLENTANSSSAYSQTPLNTPMLVPVQLFTPDEKKIFQQSVYEFVKESHIAVKSEGNTKIYIFKFLIQNKDNDTNETSENNIIYKNFKNGLDKLGLNFNLNINNENDTFDEIKLDEQQIQQIVSALEPDQDAQSLLGDVYYIKSIRADYNNFFESSFLDEITRSPLQQNKYPFRIGEKKAYRVNGKGPHKNFPNSSSSNIKATPEKYRGDRPFSQTQSTSMSLKNAPSNVFGHDKAKLRISAVGLHQKDVKLSERVTIYDGGTVNRVNHFHSKANAKVFYSEQHDVETESKILYNTKELNEFIEVLENFPARNNKGETYNEVLANIRWNTDGTSCLLIASDNLETRLITLYRAEILRERLKKQAKEIDPNSQWDDSYQIPIYYYCPDNAEKHFKPYNIFEQKLDLIAANNTASNTKYRDLAYNEKNYEFLLVLDTNTLNKIIHSDIIISDLISDHRLDILIPILKKISPETLKKTLRSHGKSIIKLMLKHPHANYPELIDVLVKHEIHEDINNNEINYTALKLAVIQYRTDIIENHFFNNKFFKWKQGELFQEILTVLPKLSAAKYAKILNIPAISAAIDSAYIMRNIKIENILPETVFALLHNDNYFNKLNHPEEIKKAWALCIKMGKRELLDKFYADKSKKEIIENEIDNALLDDQISFKTTIWLLQHGAKSADKMSDESKRLLIDYLDNHPDKISTIIEPLINNNKGFIFVSMPSCMFDLIYHFMLKLIDHTVKMGKYKLFKKLAALANENTLFKTALINYAGDHSNNLHQCNNLKIISYMKCLNFIPKLKDENEMTRFDFVSLEAIKHLESDDLKYITKNFLTPKNEEYALDLQWVFEKIKTPEKKFPEDHQLSSSNLSLNPFNLNPRIELIKKVLYYCETTEQHKFYIYKNILLKENTDKNFIYFSNSHTLYSAVPKKSQHTSPVQPLSYISQQR
jgi:hypothetical protein